MKFKSKEQEEAWWKETKRRIESGISYPEYFNHNGVYHMNPNL